MTLHTARSTGTMLCGLLLIGCSADRSTVTRYGPTAFTYPQGATLNGAGPSEFAAAFEARGFYAASSSSTGIGTGNSDWGWSAFDFHGKRVLVRVFALAGEPRLAVVSVDGEYGTQLGTAITDWMIQKIGLRVQSASHKRPSRMPTPAASLYDTSLFAFDAEPTPVADAVRKTAAGEGWTLKDEDQKVLDGITAARFAFLDTQGREVTVETFSPRYRPTVVEVTYSTGDRNDPLKVFNGMKDQLGLPIRTPESTPTAVASREK